MAPVIAFVGGGEVGCGFLDIISRASVEGACRLAAVVPGYREAARANDISRRAQELGVPVVAGLDALAESDQAVDLVVSAGNHLIFSAAHIAQHRLGIVNFHAAPLPEYRGSACPAFAILRGETRFGVSFHNVVPELDAGPILLQERFDILDSMTAGDVDRRCIEEGLRVFGSLLMSIVEGRARPVPMGLPSRPPYRRHELEAHRQVDLAWPSDRIWRHVRAFDWPDVLQPAFARIGRNAVVLTARPRGD